MQYEKILSDISTDVLFMADHNGVVSHGNDCAKKTFGPDKEGMNIVDIFEEQHSKALMFHIAECIKNQKQQQFSLAFRSKYYGVKIFPVQDEVAISMQDITESQNLRHTLSEMMQRLTFASKIAKIGYWELDLVAKEISWSSEMFRIFGIDDNEISLKKNIIREQMHKEDLPRYKDNLRKIMRTGKPEEGVVRIIRPNGNIIYCRYMADYINYDKYNRKIIGTFQDLTELLEIQHALVAAKESAERLNLEKSYFLAQASHDLQQPVSAMGLFINNLLNANLTGKQQFLVERIYDSAQALRHLLNNLLDVSNLDARGVSVVSKEFDLYDVVMRIQKEISFQLRDHKTTLKIVNCHQSLNSDEFLIERILRNFISNALKYARSKILIGCLRKQDKLRIMVLDNGMGIDEKELSLIFNPYYQSPNVPDNRHKGSGLGLAIAQKTANILGAEVGVLSKVGKGSNFYLEIKTNI